MCSFRIYIFPGEYNRKITDPFQKDKDKSKWLLTNSYCADMVPLQSDICSFNYADLGFDAIDTHSVASFGPSILQVESILLVLIFVFTVYCGT